MNSNEAIQRRVSCRTYSGEPLTATEKAEIIRIIGLNNQGPLGGRPQFQLLELVDFNPEELKKMGTYGFIKGARAFIAGKIKIGPEAMKDYGYCMEKIILQMTELGLGTCWLGGSLNRSGFAVPLELREGEALPAITPIGRPASQERLVGRIMQAVVKARQRKPWPELFRSVTIRQHDVYDEICQTITKPLTPEEAAQHALVLEAVRLAPSAGNKQPWRVYYEADRQQYHFFLKRDQFYDSRFKPISLQELDIGIAMCHFELVAKEAGLDGRWLATDSEVKEQLGRIEREKYYRSNYLEGYPPKREEYKGLEYMISWQAV